MRGVLAPLTKIVAFTLITALATAILGFTIANVSFGPKETYTARFTDVTGLLEGDDVRISGVVVGTVQSIEIVDRRLAEVEFTLGQSRQLPASTTASVLYKNLIGQRYLALEQGAGATGVLEPGGAIPLERTNPPLNLTVLFNGFKPLLRGLDPEEINKLSFEIVQVLQGQGSTVESLLASTASLTSEIANRDQVIGEVIGNLNAVLDTVNARDERLSDLIVALQRLVSGLAADREPIGDAIESLNSLAESTAGLVGDARPALREDIAALGALSSNLADSEEVIDRTLRLMPEKLETINRTASYGSFFNFYLCEVSGTFVLPGVTPEQGSEVTPYRNPNPRCSQ
ncbi:MAG: MCE family protein [Pseudonocardiaceae bacterium]|nr:MCE family protein [Pseudonocardiaceae bacterium]